MKIYEKVVSEARHLFATDATGIPSDSDTQLTYKDDDGAAITPVLGDTFRDHSSGKVQRIVRDSDGKAVNVFVGDKQIIGDAVTPTPVVVTYKHTMRMYANDGTSDSEFNVIVETNSDTEFTEATLEAWLSEKGYTTAGDYYTNIINVAGPTVTGVASKSTGVVACEFEGGSGTAIDTFVSDTVTPSN